MAREMDDLAKATDDWIRETTRNGRIIDACLGIPIEYLGNVAMTATLRARYTRPGLDYGSAFREMLVDNVRLDDIAALLGLARDGVERLAKPMIKK